MIAYADNLEARCLPCPFCGNLPKMKLSYESGHETCVCLVCSGCGVTTRKVDFYEYDAMRFRVYGPQSKYGGAYYLRDWVNELLAIWNTRKVAEDARTVDR